MKVEGTDIRLSSSYDLKNPNFRYMGAPAGMVPGTQHTNPTEAYFENLIPQQSGCNNSATPQSIVGAATKTDNPNLVNDGSLSSSTASGSNVVGSPNQMYSMTSSKPLGVMYNLH